MVQTNVTCNVCFYVLVQELVIGVRLNNLFAPINLDPTAETLFVLL
jgi:hypothetical protein